MKKNHRRLKSSLGQCNILLIGLLLISFQGLYAQTTISGTIVDKTGVPLAGASVVEKGTTNGASADFDGNYVLELSSDNPVLIFSYIGYSALEVSVAGQKVIDATLSEDASQLDEVVVVGYGTQQRSDVTAAISSVSAEDLGDRTTGSVANLLQGRVAGFGYYGR